jgi:PAS domain S-box-containing protein
MQDEEKTRDQLIDELTGMRQRLEVLEVGKRGVDTPEATDQDFSATDYAGTFDSIPLPATLIDAEGIVVDINQAFLDLAYSYGRVILKQDRIGGHCASFAATEKERIRLKAFIDELLRAGETQHLEWMGEDVSGQHHFWDIHASVLRDATGRITGALVLREDITARKQVEDALHESDQRFRQLADNLDGVLYVYDPGSDKFLYVSSAYENLWQQTVQSLYEDPLSFCNAVHPEDRERFQEAIRRERECGEYVNVEYRIIRPDGTERWVWARNFPIHDKEGMEYRVVGIAQDISKRKEAERNLQQAKREWESTFDAMTDWVCLVDDQNRVLRSNRAGERFVGTPVTEIVGKKICKLLHNSNGNIPGCPMKKMFETHRQESVELKVPEENRWLRVTAEPVMDPIGNLSCGVHIIRDITAGKQMEQELVRLERLSAAGELSAGVSHNLNNILTNVLGPVQLLKRKTDDPELLREADDIATSAARARDLVHDLHLSVRTEKDESLHAVSVEQVVQQAVKTARPRWKDESEARGVLIEVLIQGGDTPTILGTETGLHGILTNLIFNAVDAMPEGGRIGICTQMVEDMVQIRFSDTGTGMDEETRLRIFEPFFTTKMDIGTGLGLSTVYNTVIGWGGSIEVDSVPGEGTKFRLSFPMLIEEEVEEEGKAVARSVRSGKILVVDDDKAVRSLLSRLLGERHEVEVVVDGREALNRYAPGKYDVVMIDLGMSWMSGDQLLERIKESDPLVIAVLITGWMLPESDARLSSFDFRITKPFEDLDEVEDVVARAIELRDQRAERKH